MLANPLKTDTVTDAKKKVLIADDHALFREALALMLGQEPGIDVVGQAENGRELVRMVQEFQPDLVLTDISMPQMNGTEAISYLKTRYPDVKVIVVTMHSGAEHVRTSLKAGANGYVLKDDGQTEFLGALRNVLAGRAYLSPSISSVVVGEYVDGEKSKPSWSKLTTREREVLKLVAEGYRNREIAQTLSISQKTVEKHRANLMAKLDLHSTAELTSFAIANGIVN
jgi:DNA-binding NarL/FixJ family response regulator